MEKSIVTSGKTIDLAIDAALQQLGLDRDSVSVQVLQQAKNGFLGFGAQPAKVQVTYEAPDEAPKAPEAPKSALGSASRSKPRKPVAAPAAPKAEEKPAEVKKAEAPKEAPKAETPKAPRAPRAEKPARQPRPERKAEPRVEEAKAPAEPKVYTPAEPGSVEEKIELFLKGLLEHMEAKAVPHCWKEEEGSYKVELVGDDLGFLIGRRGETLDAIQHLTTYAINKDVEGHIRVNVDAESYRE